MMITPAGDFFKCGMASRVTLNVPFRFTWTTFSHSCGGICSTGAVCAGIPALLTNTSKPPKAFTARETIRSTSSRLEMSQTAVIRPSISVASAPKRLGRRRLGIFHFC